MTAVLPTAPSCPAPSSVQAAAHVARVDGRLTWASRPPLVLRRTGPDRVHLVQVGGGPLGGDRLALDVELGAGERLTVRTAAATVVQPGRDRAAGASFRVRARVAAGAALTWTPEPTVVTDGGDWHADLALDLAEGARAVVAEHLVLGRSGQQGGRCRSDLRVTVAGRPLLVTSTRLDGADPVLGGPGGTGGARSVATLLVAGPGEPPDGAGEDDRVTWAWTSLDGPGALFTAVGDVRATAAALAAAVAAARGEPCRRRGAAGS